MRPTHLSFSLSYKWWINKNRKQQLLIQEQLCGLFPAAKTFQSSAPAVFESPLCIDFDALLKQNVGLKERFT